jgi:hypothetical protein
MLSSWLPVPRRLLTFGSVILMSAAAACGQLDFKKGVGDADDGMVKHLGCVQGYVMNGITGARLDFAALDMAESNGIFVNVATERLGATLQKSTATPGGFRVCNVPLDEAYVLRAELPGYEVVEGLIRVRSTVAPFANEAEADIAKQVPSLNVNIAVFPRGVATQDVTFIVQSFGEQVKDATVHLKPSTGGTAALAVVDEAGFLIPTAVGAPNLTAVTDADGIAKFAAGDLMLGARYEYVVLPPAGDAFLEPIAGLFQLTVRDNNDPVTTVSPYIQFVNFQGSAPLLAELQFSTDSLNYDESGSLIVVFNRKVEILPGTEDEIVATLADANGATLQADVRGNFKPDQVSYKIDGYRLILTPKWDQKPRKDREGGLTVTYSGIRVRPATTPRTADVLVVGDARPGALTVPVFGAITPEQIAAALGKPEAHGDGQSAPAGSILGNPLKVQVLDQFGQPYVRNAVNVTFRVVTGTGGVAYVGSSAFSESVTLATDPMTGIATASFKLGNEFGAQKVEALIADTPIDISFTATGYAAATSVAVIDGANGTAPADNELATPVVVQVYDQFRNPLTSGADVTFVPSSGGTVRASGSFQGILTTRTDAEGRATARWKLGSAIGRQTLEVRLDGVTQTTVAATALARLTSLAKAAGDGASVDPNADVTMVVQLRDHLGGNMAVANHLVRFEVTRGTGTLRARAADPVGSATALEVATDGSGRATIVMRVTGGNPNTAFDVVARTGSLTAVTFTGTVRAALRGIAAAAGDAQSAPVNSDLASPLMVQLKDQSGADLALSGVPVTFTLDSGTGQLRAVGSTGTGTNTVTVYTDTLGQARALYRVTGGTVGSAFRVTASAAGVTAVAFTGTVGQ